MQALLSSHPTGLCAHAPVRASQESAVQALSSSQPSTVWTHPVWALQESVVQGLSSSQFRVVLAQPVCGSQESVVQALLSLQLMVVLTQPVRALQESVVQALLSLQPTGAWAHPVCGSQESVVHALLSLQLVEAVAHVPMPLQTPAEECVIPAAPPHIAMAQLSPSWVWHCPAAVQVFLFPQVALTHMPVGSTVPAATFAQVPPAPVQVWHLPHEAVRQQRSFTQLPIKHSLPAAQISPGPFFGTQEPALVGLPVQRNPVAQSVAAVQVVRH